MIVNTHNSLQSQVKRMFFTTKSMSDYLMAFVYVSVYYTCILKKKKKILLTFNKKLISSYMTLSQVSPRKISPVQAGGGPVGVEDDPKALEDQASVL